IRELLGELRGVALGSRRCDRREAREQGRRHGDSLDSPLARIVLRHLDRPLTHWTWARSALAEYGSRRRSSAVRLSSGRRSIAAGRGALLISPAPGSGRALR